MPNDNVKISLRKDEALLVDAFLRKYTEDDLLRPTRGESQALFNLACVLEKELPELFLEDYAEILAQAELEVFEKEG